jgi:hypothetical protein
MYRQFGFEGFETESNPKWKFDINSSDYSTDHSHTGKKSVKVNKGTPKSIIKQLHSKQYIYTLDNCPVLPGSCSSLYTVGSGKKSITFVSPISQVNNTNNNGVNFTKNGSTLSIYFDQSNDDAWGNYSVTVTLNTGQIIILNISISGCNYQGQSSGSCVHGISCQ